MSLSFRVARCIYRYIMDGEEIAYRLGMSQHAMSYRLSLEGTNLSKIRSNIRHRMAVRLIDQGKTTECILHELGIKSRVTLFDAFLRWEGKSYAEYRRGYLDNLTFGG